MEHSFADFTETEFRNLLRLAKANWPFASFTEYRRPGRRCLWRHDVDNSMHRAYRIACIEAEEGLCATYFVSLHDRFYNCLEDDVAYRVRAIRDLGHQIGLHFDPCFYEGRLDTEAALERWLGLERHMLEAFFDTEVKAFSFHNPTVSAWARANLEEVAGMVNASSQFIRDHYGYCSDSNGYWRFRRLRDVLEAATDEKLHVLTHPIWWTPEPMSPRDRVSRCIDGRAARQHREYDHFLAQHGRKNVR